MAIKKRSCTHAAATLIFIFLCFCMGPSPSHSINSITQGQNLTDGDILVSARVIFALGFFSCNPRYSTSSSRYLGIWFREGGEKINPVWVANRDTPIPDLTGVLIVDADEKLKIMYGSNNSIIMSNSITSNTTTATVLDSGNFVLNGTTGEGGMQVLWQSFDYPTNIFLAGMKLGMNLKTGQTWSLTLYLSDQVLASGAFTLELDHDHNNNGTNGLIISQRGELYWRSGISTGSNFDNIHDERLTDHLNFSFVLNKDEKYFNIYSTSDEMNDHFSSVILVKNSLGEVTTNYGDPLIECESSLGDTIPYGCVGLQKPLACRSAYDDQHFV